MTADELAQDAEERMRRMMTPLGFDDIINIDMTKKIMSASEYIPDSECFTERTVNYPALESIKNNEQMCFGYKTGFTEECSKIIPDFGRVEGIGSLSDITKARLACSFSDDLAKCSISSAVGESFASSLPSDITKAGVACSFSEMEAKTLHWPMPVIPERMGFEIPELSLQPISPLPSAMNRFEEIIDKLVEKLEEKGSRVIVIAKDKSVIFMDNASHNIINTGDIISDESERQ